MRYRLASNLGGLPRAARSHTARSQELPEHLSGVVDGVHLAVRLHDDALFVDEMRCAYNAQRRLTGVLLLLPHVIGLRVSFRWRVVLLMPLYRKMWGGTGRVWSPRARWHGQYTRDQVTRLIARHMLGAGSIKKCAIMLLCASKAYMIIGAHRVSLDHDFPFLYVGPTPTFP